MKESQKAEMEKLMADLAGAIQGHNPKSFAALNKSANGKMMGKAASKRSAEDAARVAQELIYDAWEEGNKNKRISLAKKPSRSFRIAPTPITFWLKKPRDLRKKP